MASPPAAAAALPPYLADIRRAVIQDPGLPNPRPTISLWQQPPHPTVDSVQSAVLPTRSDYVVIGSGITGCSVTKTLLEAETAGATSSSSSSSSHVQVTLLEARNLVSGATGRNGGHLVSAAGHTYADLAERYGEANAKQITRFSIRNIEHMLRMVREMDPALQAYSEIRDLTKVMVAEDAATWEASKRSVQAFQAAVPEHSGYHTLVEKEDVAERWNVKNGCGAIEHPAGAVWPYRLLTGLVERLLRQYPGRLAVEAHTPVTDIVYEDSLGGDDNDDDDDDDDYPYAVVTPRGTLRARHVVHCTNAFAGHLLPALRGKVYPFRGHMSVQRAGPDLPRVGHARSWSRMGRPTLDPGSGRYETGLVYLQQNAATGDLWVGTESARLRDILTSDDAYVAPEAAQALASFLPGFFRHGWGDATPHADVRGLWSGVQGHTADGLPLVGRLPASVTGRPARPGRRPGRTTGEWIAAGFNGYGMDKCWLTGEALARMVATDGRVVDQHLPACYLLSEERVAALTLDRVLARFEAVAASTPPADLKASL